MGFWQTFNWAIYICTSSNIILFHFCIAEIPKQITYCSVRYIQQILAIPSKLLACMILYLKTMFNEEIVLKLTQLFKGLRKALKRFVATMHQNTGGQKVSIPSTLSDITYCPHKPRCIVTTSPEKNGLNHDCNVSVLISSNECYYFALKTRIW